MPAYASLIAPSAAGLSAAAAPVASANTIMLIGSTKFLSVSALFELFKVAI
jgi:hypothetical protein